MQLPSKDGICQSCQQSKTIYQITKDETFPGGGRTFEHWMCDECCCNFYDSFIETFAPKRIETIELPIEPSGKNHCGDRISCYQKAYSEYECDCKCTTRCGPWNKYKIDLANYQEAKTNDNQSLGGGTS